MKGKTRYQLPKKGIQIISAIMNYWNNQIPALLALVNNEELILSTKNLSEMEQHLFNARNEILKLSNLYRAIKNKDIDALEEIRKLAVRLQKIIED